MEKTLQVNNGLKSALQKMMIKEKGRKAKAFLKVFITVAVFACFAACFFNIFSADRAIVYVGGVPKKDYESIILTTLLGLILLALVYTFAALFVNRFSTVAELSRIDEGLTVTNNSVLYSYRIKHLNQPTDRFVVYIPVESISKIYYNEKTRKISFKGSFCEEYVEMYAEKNRQTLTQNKIDSFVIVDWFEPSLKDLLIENGLYMKDEEK